MNTKTMNNRKLSLSKVSGKAILAIGAGVAAIATTSYYFFGPDGRDHRERLKGWMIKMKGEIIERIEDVKELTEPIYHEIIDSVVLSYMAAGKVSKEEIQAYADKLKSQWENIRENILAESSKKTSEKVIKTVKARRRKTKN